MRNVHTDVRIQERLTMTISDHENATSEPLRLDPETLDDLDPQHDDDADVKGGNHATQDPKQFGC